MSRHVSNGEDWGVSQEWIRMLKIEIALTLLHRRRSSGM
jgi:hypothetical protein